GIRCPWHRANNLLRRAHTANRQHGRTWLHAGSFHDLAHLPAEQHLVVAAARLGVPRPAFDAFCDHTILGVVPPISAFVDRLSLLHLECRCLDLLPAIWLAVSLLSNQPHRSKLRNRCRLNLTTRLSKFTIHPRLRSSVFNRWRETECTALS